MIPLVTDVLEHERHFRLAHFCPKEIVVVVLQFPIREMVPPVHSSELATPHGSQSRNHHSRARVAVKQRGCFDELPAVPAPLALERLVRLAERVLLELKQLPEGVQREVSLNILLLVHDRRRERLLVSLPLEDLLLNSTRGDETVDKT